MKADNNRFDARHEREPRAPEGKPHRPIRALLLAPGKAPATIIFKNTEHNRDSLVDGWAAYQELEDGESVLVFDRTGENKRAYPNRRFLKKGEFVVYGPALIVRKCRGGLQSLTDKQLAAYKKEYAKFITTEEALALQPFREHLFRKEA